MRRTSGFTLYELMLVMAIIVVIASIAIPSIIGWLPKYRLGSAARTLLSTMQYARLRAVKGNVTVRMKFNPDRDNYIVFQDVDNDMDQDIDEPAIRSGKMPGGINLKGTNFRSDSFHFDGRGLATGSGGTITLENSLKDQARIRVNRTGNSRILEE